MAHKTIAILTLLTAAAALRVPRGFEIYGEAQRQALIGDAPPPQCSSIPPPNMPSKLPDWGVGTRQQLKAKGFAEIKMKSYKTGAFWKKNGKKGEVVMKECTARAFEEVVKYTAASGTSRNPFWTIFFDCTGDLNTIKVSKPQQFGDKWKKISGTWKLVSFRFNVELHGDFKHRILEILPRAHVFVHGITFRGGRVTMMKDVLTQGFKDGGGANGGAVLVYPKGAFTSQKCNFINNFARSYFARWGSGGAVKCEPSSYCMIRKCYFKDNQAATGGAVASSSAKVVHIYDSTFYRNTALGGVDGSLKKKGRTKNLILVRGGAVRADSVTGHESEVEHVMVCNSRFIRNNIKFTQQTLKETLGYKDPNDLGYVRAAGAAVTFWNAKDNLNLAHTKHFLTLTGCEFALNEESVEQKGNKIGRYVAEVEGSGDCLIENTKFFDNKVTRAVLKINNSKTWGDSKTGYRTVLKSLDFYDHKKLHSMEFETKQFKSKCVFKDVSGIPDQTGDCRKSMMAAIARGGNLSTILGDGFDEDEGNFIIDE